MYICIYIVSNIYIYIYIYVQNLYIVLHIYICIYLSIVYIIYIYYVYILYIYSSTGTNNFFLGGDKPTSIDAFIFGHLAEAVTEKLVRISMCLYLHMPNQFALFSP